MLYMTFPAEQRVQYLSCGRLIESNGFVHKRRNIGSFVLIYVVEGTLHIAQHDHEYAVAESEFIILHANAEHFGCRPSQGMLNYFWVHFLPPAEGFLLRNEEEVLGGLTGSLSRGGSARDEYLLPEHGRLLNQRKLPVMFSQLLDLSLSDSLCSQSQLHFYLSALMLELTGETMQRYQDTKELPLRIYLITEYIRQNYPMNLSVRGIAEVFHYHPDYLSSEFLRHCKMSMIHYINRTRIEVAKKMLSDQAMSVFEITDYCGFNSSKYFARVFRRLEGVTPSEYREAFYKKKDVFS